MLHVITALALAAGLLTKDSTELRREDLMTALRSGGYTVILRHARTDRSFQEQTNIVPKERSAQRNLTDDGFKDAALMGVAFRKHGITFADIISSPMYRCTETAELAVGKPTSVTMDLRVFPTTKEQEALVKTPPKPGTNRILVTHHFVIELYVPGIRPGDIGESEAVVIRHTNDGKVELVGRITLDDWSRLVNPSPATIAKPAPAPLSPDAAAVVHAGGYAAQHNATRNHTDTAAHIPDTHAGHIAREYIAAFNTGSVDKMKAFLEQWAVPDPARPTAERVASYAKLFEQHGPLSVAGIDTSEATLLTMGMHSKVGHLRLTVKSSDAQPMRFASVTFTMMQPGGHR
ncbi:MAG TPA: histidine phosphatase family protein [Gemmatimonadaceae bacterium]|nr:histidine phosphatase family protein [Gemmatimonadaceae bacterium]